MNFTRQFPLVAAALCLAACAGVIPQFSDHIYSAELASADHNSAEVGVTHGLDGSDVAQVVWIARAAYPVAQEHCASMGKTAASRYQTLSTSSGTMVFRFLCVAWEEANTED